MWQHHRSHMAKRLVWGIGKRGWVVLGHETGRERGRMEWTPATPRFICVTLSRFPGFNWLVRCFSLKTPPSLPASCLVSRLPHLPLVRRLVFESPQLSKLRELCLPNSPNMDNTLYVQADQLTTTYKWFILMAARQRTEVQVQAAPRMSRKVRKKIHLYS